MHGSKATEDSKIISVGDNSDTLNIKDDFQFYHTGEEYLHLMKFQQLLLDME